MEVGSGGGGEVGSGGGVDDGPGVEEGSGVGVGVGDEEGLGVVVGVFVGRGVGEGVGVGVTSQSEVFFSAMPPQSQPVMFDHLMSNCHLPQILPRPFSTDSPGVRVRFPLVSWQYVVSQQSSSQWRLTGSGLVFLSTKARG
ncbi:MAG: hypothetical protein G01um101416_1192 [Microgenomates group bacterium Gr01-1014_16]|nr:MAG: hypothetical protein G01um101416_1192 [Microgenomates group bacterium Gr01-1014_16]